MLSHWNIQTIILMPTSYYKQIISNHYIRSNFQNCILYRKIFTQTGIISYANTVSISYICMRLNIDILTHTSK